MALRRGGECFEQTGRLVRAAGIEPARGFPQRIFLPATAFTATPFGAFVVWTIPSPWRVRALGAARLVSTPSQGPPSRPQGLARDRHVRGFPEFEQFYVADFPARTQVA